MLTTARPWWIHSFVDQSKSLRAGPTIGVQETFQVIGAVEGDAYDSAFVPEQLHLDVSLKPFTKLVLDALTAGVLARC